MFLLPVEQFRLIPLRLLVLLNADTAGIISPCTASHNQSIVRLQLLGKSVIQPPGQVPGVGERRETQDFSAL